MRSMMIWMGVLVGSVLLGVGLYGLVIRPADAAGLQTVPAASQPSPTPTIYHYKTKIVKDPPKHKVVDVPAPPVAAADASTGSGGGSSSWSGSSGSSSTSAASRDDGGSSGYSTREPSDDNGSASSSDDGGARSAGATRERESGSHESKDD